MNAYHLKGHKTETVSGRVLTQPLTGADHHSGFASVLPLHNHAEARSLPGPATSARGEPQHAASQVNGVQLLLRARRRNGTLSFQSRRGGGGVVVAALGQDTRGPLRPAHRALRPLGAPPAPRSRRAGRTAVLQRGEGRGKDGFPRRGARRGAPRASQSGPG